MTWIWIEIKKKTSLAAKRGIGKGKKRVCGDITEIDSASVVEEEIITHYVYFTSTRTDDLVVGCK